jgi:hypothetical protein
MRAQICFFVSIVFSFVAWGAVTGSPITKDSGRVRAEARVVAQGRQIISAEARVLGGDGKVLRTAPRL